MAKAIITDDLDKYKIYDIDTTVASYKDYYTIKKDCENIMNYIKDLPTNDKKRKIILAIVGPSASGKDTLAKELAFKLNCKMFISDTTRPRRKNEVDGIDYHFISNQEFLDNIDNNKYLEWTSFKGWFYGTPKNQLTDLITVGVFNVEGLSYLYRKNPDIEIIPIYLNDRYITRLKRSIKREKRFKVEYLRRGIVDAMDFTNFKNYLKCYNKYINMSDNDWTIEQMSDRVVFMLKRWAILDNPKK